MKVNTILAALAVILGTTAAFTNHSEKAGLYPSWKFDTERVGGEKVHYISASHLADMIYSKDTEIKILDVRSDEDYRQYHIPSSLHFPKGETLEGDETRSIQILIGDEEDEMGLEAGALPEGKVFILKGGIEQWYELVLFPDFLKLKVRNSQRLREIHYRSHYFGGTPMNSQLLNISVRENRFREGC